jgi:hypothetical protein
MAEIGCPPELAWLPIAKLEVDPLYQRSLDTPAGRKLVDKISAEFSWAKFQAILATPKGREERWLIIDGQHRAAGARNRGIEHVPAVVIAGLSVEQQADAFVGANRTRVPINAQQLYAARLVAGDQEALTIKRLCDGAGIRVLHYNLPAVMTPSNATAAVPALLRLLRQRGENIAGKAISALGAAFDGKRSALRGPFFTAAGRFLAEGRSAEDLVIALRRLGPDNLASSGRHLGGNAMVEMMTRDLLDAVEVGVLRAPSAEPSRKAIPPAGASKPRQPGASMRLPAAISAPRAADSPAPIDKRALDQKAINAFIAAKGSRMILSLEQAAQFLRDAGHRAIVSEQMSTCKGQKDHKPGVSYNIQIDGKAVSIDHLYARVNELRSAAGLSQVAPR